MESASSISMLKVDWQCSRDCPIDVKKMLEQYNGVESISIDPKRGMVRVFGKVNPMILVKLLQKMGQRVELWSFQKAPHQAKSYPQTKRHTNDYHKNHNSRCCHDDDESSSSISSSSSSTDSYRGYAWKKNSRTSVYRQLPERNAEMSKKKKSWKRWLCLGDTFMEPKVWIKSPRRPINFPRPPPVSQYNSLIRLSTAPVLHARPPMSAYGYGYYNGFPMPVPSDGRSSYGQRYINPMIHYTSYADNFC